MRNPSYRELSDGPDLDLGHVGLVASDRDLAGAWVGPLGAITRFFLAAVFTWLALGGASQASQAAATVPVAFVRADISGGNGNGKVDRRECNSLSVVLRNTSGQVIHGLEAHLLTTTAGVEITATDSTYPDFDSAQSQTNATPFAVSTADNFQCGATIQFILMLYQEGVLQGQVPFSLTTPTNCVDGGGACPSTFVLKGALKSNDPRQYGRLQRTTTNTTCQAPTTCPGLASSEDPPLLHRYDHWVLENQANRDNCVSIEFLTDCDHGEAPLFCAVYLNSFNAGNLCQNYLADVGSSPTLFTPVSCSFKIPAQSRAVVVVHEVKTETECDSYTLNVTAEQGFVFYRPEIKCQAETPSVLIIWPTNAWRYTLESTPAVVPTTFTAVTNTPGLMNEFFVVTNGVDETSRYYRLRQLYY